MSTKNYRVQLLMVFPPYTQAFMQAQMLHIMYMVGSVKGWARSGGESRSVVDASGRLLVLSPPIISGYALSSQDAQGSNNDGAAYEKHHWATTFDQSALAEQRPTSTEGYHPAILIAALMSRSNAPFDVQATHLDDK